MPEHSVTVVDADSHLAAHCSCGWRGVGFSGQEARRAAEADGQEHLMRAQQSSDGYDPRWPADD